MARRLWARLMKERFQAEKSSTMMLRFHTQTAGSSLTAQQVDNNIVRVTIQALAAVLGGTQSLHTNALDEAIALPTDFSARIARNTQLYLQLESGTTKVIDPWGGSYYVERLTRQLAERAWTHIVEVEELGGMASLATSLTDRELQVLKQLATGSTNKQIAQALGISYETVKEHVQHILRKVGVADRTQAAVWAVRKGLV